MKRFFTIVAAALMTTAFASSASAGWGPNGMYGNADPNAPSVGQSSTPSTNPASAPITTPFDPNADLGAIPGSYKDPAMQAKHSKAWQAAQYAKAKANFDKKQYSPRLAPQNLRSPMSGPMNGLNVPTGNTKRSTGFFGNDVLSRGAPQMPRPSRLSNFPPMPPRAR